MKENNMVEVNKIIDYDDLYKYSLNENDAFWEKQAERLDWYRKWDTVSQNDFKKAEIEWYSGGILNASFNCIDRHVNNGLGEKEAIFWEGNDTEDSLSLSYSQLLYKVSKFANGLKSIGIKKGDRVCIYMQMVPELAIAMLACARIGAVHSIVFGAFSSDSLKDRINDSQCKVLITQDTGVRGKKTDIPMKVNADNAIKDCPSINNVIVVKRTGSPISMNSIDIWWDDLIENLSDKLIITSI